MDRPAGRVFPRPSSLLKRALAALALTFFFAAGASASSSVNVPVGSRAYEDLERLEVKGLITSGLLATRPFSRIEAARLIKEAERPDAGFSGTLERLKRDFAWELKEEGPSTYVRPVSAVYAKSLYSEKAPVYTNINNNGDDFREGGNLRAGMEAEAVLFDTLSLYLNPEYRLDGSSRGELVRGYLKADLSGVEMTAGRDSMWWGSGYHGNLLVTNNAAPLEMLKLSSSHPFILPWIFGRLGPFRPTVFIARLEEDRDFPRANLLGMRLDFKPTPRFQIALNRVFMFGGEGRRSLDATDWLNVFLASDGSEHGDSPVNGNQIASIDASYVYVNKSDYLPFSGIKLYTEWGAEDSSGKTKTPTGRANIYGAYIDGPFWLRDVDLRVEWANTGRNERYGPSWYRHGIYSSGYTYKGDIIGHHMGSDARDLFLRARYHAAGGGVIGIEADREWPLVHGGGEKKDWLGADIYFPFDSGIGFSAGAGWEKAGSVSNYPVWARLEYGF